MTPREQRQQRKKWKENIQNFRLKRKQMDNETAEPGPVVNTVQQQKPGRRVNYRILNRNKINRFRKTENMKKHIQKLKRWFCLRCF